MGSRRNYTEHELVARGQRITAILEDEVFRSALAEAGETFIDEWKHGVQTAQREAAWAKYQALSEVQRVLRTIMDNGKMSAARLTKGAR